MAINPLHNLLLHTFGKKTKMTTKLLLMAAIIATSGLFLDTNEAQAQGRRIYNPGWSNQGVNARVYSQNMNRGPVVYSNSSHGFHKFTPNNNYSSNYRNYGQYGYPSGYGYGNNFNNYRSYSYPSGVRYGSNYGNYGYRPNVGNSMWYGNSGFGNYRTYIY
jgi:hypothetical protein